MVILFRKVWWFKRRQERVTKVQKMENWLFTVVRRVYFIVRSIHLEFWEYISSTNTYKWLKARLKTIKPIKRLKIERILVNALECNSKSALVKQLERCNKRSGKLNLKFKEMFFTPNLLQLTSFRMLCWIHIVQRIWLKYTHLKSNDKSRLLLVSSKSKNGNTLSSDLFSSKSS